MESVRFWYVTSLVPEELEPTSLERCVLCYATDYENDNENRSHEKRKHCRRVQFASGCFECEQIAALRDNTRVPTEHLSGKWYLLPS